ncbi:hypothetical protein GOODEAATRI_003573 [Goodea atripinnis]|uniref:Uncharacterized protein n=1 Tax=Goodea atripinnis TaxID=208336 RepID=A0ABV0MYF0_9TELE
MHTDRTLKQSVYDLGSIICPSRSPLCFIRFLHDDEAVDDEGEGFSFSALPCLSLVQLYILSSASCLRSFFSIPFSAHSSVCPERPSASIQ